MNNKRFRPSPRFVLFIVTNNARSSSEKINNFIYCVCIRCDIGLSDECELAVGKRLQ